MFSDSPWNTDPIIITENNKPIEVTTENADFSEPVEPFPEQKRATCSGSSGKTFLTLSKEELLEFSNFKFKPLTTSDVCNEEDYDPEVLKVFSGLKRELITEMVGGACTLAKHRNSKEVMQEDLLLYLDMQWNIDPLLVSEDYYRVEMPTKKVDLPIPSKPPPEQNSVKSSGSSGKACQTASKQEIHNVLEKSPTAQASTSKIMIKNEFSIWDPELIVRKPSHEMFHAYSKFGRKPVNKRKRMVSVPVKRPEVKKGKRKPKVNRFVETPAETRKRMRQEEILTTVDTPADARKKLAMVLLRIAGKYY